MHRKEVACRSCHGTFSLHLVSRLASAALLFIAIPLILVLIPWFGIIGSILFCYLLGIGIENLLFRYSPLKTRSRKEGHAETDT